MKLTAAVSVAVRSPLEAAMDEACVARWLSHLKLETRDSYRSDFRYFLRWLWRMPEWSGKLPSELLEWQDAHNVSRGRERFALVDLMIQFIQEKGGTYSSMITQFSHLRTFFTHNRVELPSTGGWRPQPTREPAAGNLNDDQVREIIQHAGLRDRAIFITMFQSLMDLERFSQFNRRNAGPLIKHLREKGLDEPLRVDFTKGRKTNRRPFFTYLHHDALEAWRIYFDKERGWPKDGDTIAITNDGRAPKKDTCRKNFVTIAKKLRMRPTTPGERGQRTGVAPHEAFRDVVRTRLQTARKKGFDTLCAEFWMGHRIDPYNYVKFAELEQDYVLENAKIAAEYLNILSGPTTTENHQEVQDLRQKVAQLEFAVKVLQDASGLQITEPNPAGDKQR